EGWEGQRVARRVERLLLGPEQGSRPARQRPLVAKATAGLLLWEDAEAGAAQVGQFVGRLPVGRDQQSADEVRPLVGLLFLAGGRVKTAPEGTGGPLVAAAEQRPAQAALVVLGAGQGQRQQHDIVLVRQ